MRGVEEVILRRGAGQRIDWREGNHGHVLSVFGTTDDHDGLRRVNDDVARERCTSSAREPRHTGVRSRLSAALLCALLSSCGSSGPAAPARNATSTTATQRTMTPGDHVIDLTVDGRTRSFILHVPAKPHAGDGPLIFVFHGAEDSDSSTVASTDFEAVARPGRRADRVPAGLRRHLERGRGAHAGRACARRRRRVHECRHREDRGSRVVRPCPHCRGRVLERRPHGGGPRLPARSRAGARGPGRGELPASVSATCAPRTTDQHLRGPRNRRHGDPLRRRPVPGVGGGTTVLAATASAARWAALDRCSTTPAVTTPTGGIQSRRSRRAPTAPRSPCGRSPVAPTSGAAT